MKASEIKATLTKALHNPSKAHAYHVWGLPGVGKSSVQRQVADSESAEYIDLRALLLDPTDIRGIPVPEDGKARWLQPSFLPTKGRGILHLDELNRAPVLTQNSLLQLVLDHRVGEYALPPGWIITASGNREMEAFVHRMDPALLRRFTHIDFEVDMDEWVAWALQHNINPIIIAFLTSFRPNLLCQFNKSEKVDPNPRAWEFTSNIMEMELPGAVERELIKGTVGEAAATELITYQKVWNELPNLDKILGGEDTIPQSVDIMYATCVGLVSKAKTPPNYERVLKYSLKLDREFTVFLVKMLYGKDKDKVVKSKAWVNVSQTLVSQDKILS